MSYHSATILLTDRRNKERFIWEIVTTYHDVATRTGYSHKSAAYTDKSEGHRILRWVSNNTVIPSDIMEKITWPYKTEMKIVRDKDTQAAIAHYIQFQENRTPEQIAEEKFEMRAAFGAGTKVVNIFTREETTT